MPAIRPDGEPGGILAVVRKTSENRFWATEYRDSFRLAPGTALLDEVNHLRRTCGGERRLVSVNLHRSGISRLMAKNRSRRPLLAKSRQGLRSRPHSSASYTRRPADVRMNRRPPLPLPRRHEHLA